GGREAPDPGREYLLRPARRRGPRDDWRIHPTESAEVRWAPLLGGGVSRGAAQGGRDRRGAHPRIPFVRVGGLSGNRRSTKTDGQRLPDPGAQHLVSRVWRLRDSERAAARAG